MVFNGKTMIESELDVFIPDIMLAVELNGIFHYEPIHGADKLSKIQTNDHRKFQACLERGIELLTIDTSSMNWFNVKKADVFVDIIVKIVAGRGIEPLSSPYESDQLPELTCA